MSDAGMTMTPQEWLGALADAWDQGYEAGQVHSRGRLPKTRQAVNPYHITSPARGQQ